MSASESFTKTLGFFPDPAIETESKSEQALAGGQSEGTLSVSVAASLEAVEQLRSTWESWAHHPETDFEYYLHRLKNDPTILSPCVLTVCQDSIPQAILVGQVRKRRLSATVSFVNISSPEARILEVVSGGRMGNESDIIDGLLAKQLWLAAKTQGVDALTFHRLSLQSELLRVLGRMGGIFSHQRVPDIFYYSILQLTASRGNRTLAFSGKNLRETRRKTRILQRACPEGFKFTCFSRPDELGQGIADASRVSATTWQYYLGQDFLSAAQTRNDLRFFASRSSLRVYVMYINNAPCAFLIGQLYKSRFYCMYAGYNPAFAKFSVGSLLTAWAMADLTTAGAQEVDLGEGGQEHNRRLGCRAEAEGTVHVYFPTLRGIRLNLFFALVQLVRAAGRKTITHLRLDRLRKAWPQFLISRWKTRNRAGNLCP
jgi:CelD/BcsL family acetyltransferase involved in cellulose biosynthesis